jgi:predicted ATPase
MSKITFPTYTGIQRVYLQHFKAIDALQVIPLERFTALIGNNGSGKSSVFEALKLLQDCVLIGMDGAFQEWGGLERIRNYRAALAVEEITETGFRKKFAPTVIGFDVGFKDHGFHYEVHFNLSENQDFIVVEYEELRLIDGPKYFVSHIIGTSGQRTVEFWSDGKDIAGGATTSTSGLFFEHLDELAKRLMIFPFDIWEYVSKWQFLSLNAHDMGKPLAQNRLSKQIRLAPDGRNIAEYLLWLRGQGQDYLDQLIDMMRFVVPYIADIQPSVVQGFNREVELALLEDGDQAKPLPGWLLSGGTLRVLAILSQFVLPVKPKVLLIDEIENGLDPRTIGLVINLIQQEFNTEGMQVIVSSHSPYLLDLCELQHILVCEKDAQGCRFYRPDDDAALEAWKEKFGPGQLYTMGKLNPNT